tara:strand:- start:362 stop:886 length:525 start_codon:yes stop_codon:yes gene_type:complete
MKKKVIKFVVISILIFIIGVFFFGLNKSSIYNTQDLIGNKIVSIELENFYGKKKITEKDLTVNNFTLINFWASWCAPCRIEHPYLLKLNKEKNIVMLGVNFKDNKEQAKNFLKKFGNPYDSLTVDKLGKNSINFGVYGIPESILIDNDLTIIKKFIGPINESDFNFIKKKINKL